MAVTKKEILQNLVDKMQQMMESGDRPPWQKPWEPEFGDQSSPHNPITGNAYRGFNRLDLALTAALSGYSDPRWMGYRQAADQGWQVRKGEKATYIHLPVEIIVNKDQEGSPGKDGGPGGMEGEEVGRSKMLVFKRMPVFNAQQIDGIPPLERVDPKDIQPKTAELDAIAEALGITVRELPGNRAFYRVAEDLVVLPVRSSFLDQHGYDSTKAHELAHATGHEGRLGRDLANRFGSAGYASEEVTAEIGAFLLCQELGVPHHGGNPDMTEEQHATYLASWATVIREQPDLLSKAIDNGVKAAGYMSKALDLTRERGLLEKRETTKAMEFARGDYVRYRDEIGAEREGVVLDNANPGEATKIRKIYRWQDGRPGMDMADHIPPTMLPEHLMEHIPGAIKLGPDLDAIDPKTDAYKLGMGMDLSRDRAIHAVLTAVEVARGVSTRPLPVRSPRHRVNPDLVDFLYERSRVRQGEHPDFAGLSDPVANAEAFVSRQGRRDPERSAEWVRELRESRAAYGDAVGIGSDSIDLIATQMDEGVRRMERPQVGDLVRFEPHEPGVKVMPFSGRVIAALDTNTGDVRYHLRAETGPDKDIEARVYGRDGQFREIPLERAAGFDRALPEHRKEEAAPEIAQSKAVSRSEDETSQTNRVVPQPVMEGGKQVYHKVILTYRTDLKDRIVQGPIDPDKPILEVQYHPRKEISGSLKDFSQSDFSIDNAEFGRVRVETHKRMFEGRDDELRAALGKPVDIAIDDAGKNLSIAVHHERGVTVLRDRFETPLRPFGLMPVRSMDSEKAQAITGTLTHVHDTNLIEVNTGKGPVMLMAMEPDKTHQEAIRNLIGKEVEVKPGLDGTLTVAMARVRSAPDLMKAGDSIGQRDRAINDLFDHPDWQVRANGIRDVIDGMGGGQIHRALEDPDSVVRLNTLFLANQHGLASRIDEPHAQQLLSDPAPSVRGHAVGIFADRLGREGLEDFLARETHRTPRESAERALLRMQAEEQRLHPQFKGVERAEPTGMHDAEEEIGEGLGWER
jgi:antirestriction protein ArdC